MILNRPPARHAWNFVESPAAASKVGVRAVMNSEHLQLQIAAQSLAIASIQQRLRSTSMSASTRQELENELLDRVHLRFVALNAIRLMTITTAA